MVWKVILIFFGARTDVAKDPRPIFTTAGFIFICADNCFRRRLIILLSEGLFNRKLSYFSERAHTQEVMPFAELPGISRMTP